MATLTRSARTRSARTRSALTRPALGLAVAAMTAASITSAVAFPSPSAAPPTAAAKPTVVQPAAAPRAEPVAARRAPLYPLPAPAIHPTGCPVIPAPPGTGVIPRAPRPAVSEARVPKPVRQPARTVDTSAAAGTGIWVTIFRGSPFGAATAADVVKHAVNTHMTSIWIRTGSTREGLFGQGALAALLPLAHAANLKVIAWDFPTLSDPAADARRMVATLNLVEAGQQVDGVSPDVETKSEGVFLTGKRVASYFSRVSAGAGSRPVIATVLRPTDYWWGGAYPYRAEAPYADVFAPMVYWSCSEPGAATAQAVDRLKTLHRPVHVIGQAYDQGHYGRRGLPAPQEIWRFLDVAKTHGASGASLYLYEQMRGPLWRAVADYPWAG